MSEEKIVKVGSRKSELALIQTKHVISLLQDIHPEIKFEIVTMSTLGDKVLDIPLPKIGEKSLFTKELETALITGGVDFVVHSLKDLPTVLPKGMAIGAVLRREDPRDALVLGNEFRNYNIKTLPKGSIIGTSSLRRTAQISRQYPHLVVENIRGNLNTRLKKLNELNKYTAIVLAAAGMNRIGWKDKISQILEPHELMYAVGQGALAVECRQEDQETLKLLNCLFDTETAVQILAERSFLKTLGGGCSAPVAVCSKFEKLENEYILTLKGGVWSLDGQTEIVESSSSRVAVSAPITCSLCSSDKSKVNICEENRCSENCKKNESLDNELESPQKRLKTADNRGEGDNLYPALEEDPHDKCPVKLPVGVDFMGKCPYLDHTLTKCPFNGNVDTEAKEACPYLKKFSSELDKQSNDSSESSSSNEIENETNLYCGLIAPSNPYVDAFEKACLLGKQLADILVEKGAKEVMNKAQETIHASIPSTT